MLFQFNQPEVNLTPTMAWFTRVFPHLAPFAYFPALGTCCIFSYASHRLHVFLRLAPVAYFPVLGTIVCSSRISVASFETLLYFTARTERKY